MSKATPAADTPTDAGSGRFDKVPARFKDRDRWLLWDASADTPRRPHWRGDFSVSWTSQSDLQSFENAVSAAEERDSWGIGYVVLSDDSEYIIDIDGPYTDASEPREWFPGLSRFEDAGAYMEWSPSGNGIHIPVEGTPPDEWADSEVAPDVHQGVDILTNKFCTFTGDTLEAAGDTVTDVNAAPFLFECYRNLRGEPWFTTNNTDQSQYEGDEWLADDDVQAALDAINPDLAHTEWIKLGYAVHDYDSGSSGKSLFESWSQQGSKWDADAQRSIDSIWNNATVGSDVTVGTLVHKAKQNGWEPPSRHANPGERADNPASPDTQDRDIALSPGEVTAWAGLGEDETVGDLTDREKAACVWELLEYSDEYHVRVRRDNGSLWSYDNGVWEPEGERTLRHAARQALGSMNYGQNVLAELKAQARSDPRAEVSPDEFGLSPGSVAVKNGLVDIEAAATGAGMDALRDLRPEDYALTQLPVAYDPEATYDEWADHVDEWAEQGRADALQEYIGYCLHIGEIPIHRALLLVGSGANGKSTFLSVVRALLGEENTTSMDLRTLAQEKDAVADFYGAVANISDEVDGDDLKSGIGMFKKLVGGDAVRARRLYESGFKFKPGGKQLYAANEVPDVSEAVGDDDEAFWRRWLLVEFPNHYPPAERDPGLESRLKDPEPLSGVLNWAIEGWTRLLEQGHFTNEDHYAHAKRERWQSWGESVNKFVADCVERDRDAENKSTGEVYDRYLAWCQANDYDSDAGQRKVTTTLKKENVGYAKSVRTKDGVTNGYKYLGLTDEVPDLEDTPDETAATDDRQERLTD